MTTSSPQNYPHVHAGPLRGTQSLVGVMGFVWRHPSLTLLEVLWRWLAAAPLLWLAYRTLAPTWRATAFSQGALESMTFLEPVHTVQVATQLAAPFVPVLHRFALWWVPLGILLWTAAATLGRTAVLRRADPGTRPQLGPMAASTLLRACAYVCLLFLWSRGILAAVRATVTSPASRGAEPSLVLLTAAAVFLTLTAFLLWSLLVWLLDLWPLRAMTGLTLSTIEQKANLRGKLIETNLVMGIVRVALLVLAMTFSASPLPFQTKETQVFINVWWVATTLFYIFSSDFFHVVRRVTYLRLLQSIATGTSGSRSVAS